MLGFVFLDLLFKEFEKGGFYGLSKQLVKYHVCSSTTGTFKGCSIMVERAVLCEGNHKAALFNYSPSKIYFILVPRAICPSAEAGGPLARGKESSGT